MCTRNLAPYVVAAVLAVLASVVSACSPIARFTAESARIPRFAAGAAADGLECQPVVEAFKALTDDLEWPEHLYGEDSSRRADDFDVNKYFDVLQHLAMAPGRLLDYVYYYDGMGGHPVLYSRPAEQPAYATIDDFYAGEEKPTYRASVDRWIADVQTDDTAQSYLELAILHLLGGQFYLYWHSGYNDAQIVCSQAMLDQVLAQKLWYDEEHVLSDRLSVEQLAAARALDVTPTVTVDSDTVIVRFVVFTHWGGFLEITDQISRGQAHTITMELKSLVDYDCGVLF